MQEDDTEKLEDKNIATYGQITAGPQSWPESRVACKTHLAKAVFYFLHDRQYVTGFCAVLAKDPKSVSMNPREVINDI